MTWRELLLKCDDPEKAREYQEARAWLADFFERAWAGYIDWFRVHRPGEPEPDKESARRELLGNHELLDQEIPAEDLAEEEARIRRSGWASRAKGGAQ